VLDVGVPGLRGLLFDLDGVLVDSREVTRRYYQEILLRAGANAGTIEDILELAVQIPKDQFLAVASRTLVVEKSRLVILCMKEPYPTHLVSIPDYVSSQLSRLQERVQFGLVTSRTAQETATVLEGRSLKFDAIVTVDDVAHPKPSADPINLALRRLQLSANESLYIGDMPTDFEAARAAGVSFVGVGSAVAGLGVASIRNMRTLPEVLEQIVLGSAH
jgi:phosphoglycolate phosphatase-like HAD superfamily hydrolase